MVNCIGTIAISQGWRYTTTILHIGDMLLEYNFLYFGLTRSVYEFGIFMYVPICPSLSAVLALLQYAASLRTPAAGDPRSTHCRTGDRSRGGLPPVCLPRAGAGPPLPLAQAGARRPACRWWRRTLPALQRLPHARARPCGRLPCRPHAKASRSTRIMDTCKRIKL